MSSKENRAAKAAKKKTFYRIIAGVACAALLLTAILPYVISGLYSWY